MPITIEIEHRCASIENAMPMKCYGTVTNIFLLGSNIFSFTHTHTHKYTHAYIIYL